MCFGGGPYRTKEGLENGVSDCTGFTISLYNIFFNVNLTDQLSRTDIYETCENVNMNGLKGKRVFSGGKNGVEWNSQIQSIIQPGDLVWTPGHSTIYAGDIKGDGNLYTLSQGNGYGPDVIEASSYYKYHSVNFDARIKGIIRFVGNANLIAGLNTSGNDNSRIYPTKTFDELMDAYNKYGNGKGYSYDDMYFAYYHIEQYYGEINELNGHSVNGDNRGTGLGWPVDIQKYPGCDIINCFYGYTSAYGGSHSGVDISAGGHITGSTLHVGPEVIAAHDGTVTVASANPTSDQDDYTCVQIKTDDGKIETQYGHLSKIMVRQGDKVKKGDVIGKMGTTGNSTGTHLHFVVFENGIRTDPLNYYVIAREGSDEEVDYSKIDKNSIRTIPTGYKYLRSKGGGGTQLVDFIFAWEGSTATNRDGTKYQIVTDPSAGTRTVGHGLDLDAGGYDAVLRKAGYSTTLGSYVDKDFADALALKDIENRFRNDVVAKTSGLNLKDFQIDALTSRAYNCGIAGALDYSRGGYSNFNDAYNKCWKNSDFKNSADYSHPLYTRYMSSPITSGDSVLEGLIKRRKSEWALFQTGVYDASH